MPHHKKQRVNLESKRELYQALASQCPHDACSHDDFTSCIGLRDYVRLHSDQAYFVCAQKEQARWLRMHEIRMKRGIPNGLTPSRRNPSIPYDAIKEMRTRLGDMLKYMFLARNFRSFAERRKSDRQLFDWHDLSTIKSILQTNNVQHKTSMSIIWNNKSLPGSSTRVVIHFFCLKTLLQCLDLEANDIQVWSSVAKPRNIQQDNRTLSVSRRTPFTFIFYLTHKRQFLGHDNPGGIDYFIKNECTCGHCDPPKSVSASNNLHSNSQLRTMTYPSKPIPEHPLPFQAVLVWEPGGTYQKYENELSQAIITDTGGSEVQLLRSGRNRRQRNVSTDTPSEEKRQPSPVPGPHLNNTTIQDSQRTFSVVSPLDVPNQPTTTSKTQDNMPTSPPRSILHNQLLVPESPSEQKSQFEVEETYPSTRHCPTRKLNALSPRHQDPAPQDPTNTKHIFQQGFCLSHKCLQELQNDMEKYQGQIDPTDEALQLEVRWCPTNKTWLCPNDFAQHSPATICSTWKAPANYVISWDLPLPLECTCHPTCPSIQSSSTTSSEPIIIPPEYTSTPIVNPQSTHSEASITSPVHDPSRLMASEDPVTDSEAPPPTPVSSHPRTTPLEIPVDERSSPQGPLLPTPVDDPVCASKAANRPTPCTPGPITKYNEEWLCPLHFHDKQLLDKNQNYGRTMNILTFRFVSMSATVFNPTLAQVM